MVFSGVGSSHHFRFARTAFHNLAWMNKEAGRPFESNTCPTMPINQIRYVCLPGLVLVIGFWPGQFHWMISMKVPRRYITCLQPSQAKSLNQSEIHFVVWPGHSEAFLLRALFYFLFYFSGTFCAVLKLGYMHVHVHIAVCSCSMQLAVCISYTLSVTRQLLKSSFFSYFFFCSGCCCS